MSTNLIKKSLRQRNQTFHGNTSAFYQKVIKLLQKITELPNWEDKKKLEKHHFPSFIPLMTMYEVPIGSVFN